MPISTPAVATPSTTIATDATLSAAVDFTGCSVGVFQPSAGFDGSAVTFMVCDTIGGTYAPLYGSTGSLVTVTGMVALGWYPLPVELAGACFFKFKTVTNQATTETTFKVMGLG